MSSKRVHYREDQKLTYGELSDEQAYRIAMRRRHNLAHHGWGIVQGLVLRATPTGAGLSPGFAVDGYGRELVVPRALRLGRGEFDKVLDAGAAGCVDVWLTYQLVMPARPGDHCYEDAWVRLDCCDDPETLVDPRRPREVPLSALDSSHGQEPRDDPEREWPVYLGRIAVGVGESDARTYQIELTERPYASLVGASLQTPTGKRWMQIGDEEAADNRRFAISLPDEQGKGVDRLALGRDGDPTLWGKLRLSPAGICTLLGDGDLALLGTAPDFGAHTGIGLNALASTPETALPWQLYRTGVEVEQGQQTLEVDQLRFETFHPGEEGDPGRAKWVIGHWVEPRDEQTFASQLTVRSDGTVIIDGDLMVEGQLIEGAVPADVEDERFRDQLLERWTKGLTLAGTEVDAYYELPVTVSVRGDVSNIEDSDYKAINYEVTIAHTGGGGSREVPVLAIIGEFRNEDRLLIHSESLKLEFQPDGTLPNPNPLKKPGDKMNIDSKSKLSVKGAITLTVRVIALGAAQNQVEKTANAVFHL